MQAIIAKDEIKFQGVDSIITLEEVDTSTPVSFDIKVVDVSDPTNITFHRGGSSLSDMLTAYSLILSLNTKP